MRGDDKDDSKLLSSGRHQLSKKQQLESNMEAGTKTSYSSNGAGMPHAC